jgi:hypothetical protein
VKTHQKIRKTIVATVFWALFNASVFAQCPIAPSTGVGSSEWDGVFTQDGPGKGLEPAGSPGWTGGDSTYSILLPNGDTAFFFSDSYIAESPRMNGDGTISRDAAGLRTTKLNCFPPICDPAASVFKARNSIVILNRRRTSLKTLVGKKDGSGLSTSYFAEPGPGFCYWMGDSILRKSGKRKKDSIVVFLHKFDSKLAFHGAAVAQLDVETLAIEKQNELKNLSSNNIHWGTGLLLNGEHLYIYGKGTQWNKKQVFIARTGAHATFEELSDVLKWQVWDGRSWGTGLEKAASIIPTGDSVSDEFNVVRVSISGRSIFILAALDTTVPFGSWKDITLYSSCAPEGPFAGKHVVYTAPESGSFSVPGLAPSERLKEGLVVYNPHIHPQLSEPGSLLISYNINRRHNADSIYIDGYRPRFISVPIAGLK